MEEEIKKEEPMEEEPKKEKRKRKTKADTVAEEESKRLSMHDTTDKDDMPREKLARHGARALKDYELVALIMRTGAHGMRVLDAAKQLVDAYNGSLIRMAGATPEDMERKALGLGKAKALEIKAALELGRRLQVEMVEHSRLSNSEMVYEFLLPHIGDLEHEEFWAVVLGANNVVVSYKCISQGGFTQASVDIRMLMEFVVINRGVGFVVGHNHPSGSCEPSGDDINLTNSIKKAAQTLGLKMRDHIIVARGNKLRYYSFHDNDML